MRDIDSFYSGLRGSNLFLRASRPSFRRNRVSLQVVVLVLGIFVIGCHRSDEPSPATSNTAAEPPKEQTAQTPSTDHLTTARRQFKIRNWDAAADAAYKALVQDPDNVDALLLAAQIEAERGNRDVSAELAGSIDLRSRMGLSAVDIQVSQLVALDRTSDAIGALLPAVAEFPNEISLRHRAWELLGRVGRREEASEHAQFLVRTGKATTSEFLSLVRRTASYPFLLSENEDPRRHFEDGLGMSRWYFTQQEYQKALQELSEQNDSGFESPEASALYGRLLAETQSLGQVPNWAARCSDAVRRFGDFWAALGSYFFDQRQYEASARALLEAVQRNPTDRISVQRLAKVFDALGRPDDAEQFRDRGIKLANAELNAEVLMKSFADDAARRQLAQLLIELGRPFEALALTELAMPGGATSQRTALARQRAALLRSPAALSMSSQASLVGIDPQQFSLDSAMSDLMKARPERDEGTAGPRVESLASPRFVNVATDLGLDFRWFKDEDTQLGSIALYESVGGGIAVIDFDLDGWPDVYLAQGSGRPPTTRCTRSNVLFRNVDATSFLDVTSEAGAEDDYYGAGLATGDVNQDGFPDLYLGSLERNRLLINNGDGTFRDATELLGKFPARFTSSVAIADINGDSLPDLFEAVYIEMEDAFRLPATTADGTESLPSPLLHYAQSDRWYENLGDGRFQIHEITGDVAKPGTSLGLLVTDFDSDGSNEVFVGNDVRPNHFLHQLGNNRFVNTADAMGVANGFTGAPNGCMGIAAGDFDRDGTLDMHITNFHQESSNLYLQAASGGFTDFAVRFGIDTTSMFYVGFGTKAIDIDRNGWLDLVVTNGHTFDMQHAGHGFRMPPQVLMRRGSLFEAVQVDDESGYWERDYLGRSMASLDFNRDGAMDLLVGHLDDPVALLRNETESPGDWVQFELVGTRAERDAIGAKIVLSFGEESLTQWVTAGDGYYCSDESVIDFGMGGNANRLILQVFWPSGLQQTFKQLSPGERYLIVEGESAPFSR